MQYCRIFRSHHIERFNVISSKVLMRPMCQCYGIFINGNYESASINPQGSQMGRLVRQLATKSHLFVETKAREMVSQVGELGKHFRPKAGFDQE